MAATQKKGYYEDYLRKQSLDRALADPPALLTDRSAYVNFLEVQLERVSAACMNVSAYDQRFNDMQGLIVSLEERCATTTKLVSLAQQCTEEVRSETDTKFASLVDNITDENKKVKEALTVVAGRVSDTEIALADMAVLPARLGNAEARISEAEETAKATAMEALEERRVTNNRLEELESARISTAHSIDDINASLSRQNKEIEANHSRFSQLLVDIENRVDERFNQDREVLDKKIEHVTWQMNRDTDRISEKVKGIEEAVVEQKKDLQASITHQTTMLRQDFADLHSKYAESMKASLTKHINSVHQELDDMHEFTEALEKKMKDRDRLTEQNEEKLLAALDDNRTKISASEHKIDRVSESLDKLQPVLSSLAKQQRQLREKAEHMNHRTELVEKQASMLTDAMKQLVEKTSRTDQQLAHEHQARLQAQASMKAEADRMMKRIEEEADMLAKEHAERLEAEHRQAVVDDGLRAKLAEEAAALAREHKARLEAEHLQRAIDQDLHREIDAEVEALKREHAERLLNEEKQRDIDHRIMREIEKEAQAIAEEHKHRIEQEIMQKDIDARMQASINEEATRLADEHRARLEGEMRVKTLTDTLLGEIEAEARKLAQEHEERLLAERKQEQVDEDLRRKIAKEGEDIKREHRERITAQKMQEAILTARIDDEHEEVRMLERKRLETETRQRRIDGELRLKIEEEAGRVAEEHRSRLEESHRQERINETVASGIQEQAQALAGEHRERRLEEAKQQALSADNRRRIDEEVEAIQREHLERLEAQHRQTDLDEDIKRRIEEEAQKVREKHRQIHQAEAQLRMDTAMLGASVDGISTRLATDEVQLQSNQLAIEREVARAQQVEALVQAHQKAQERTQAARDAHMEAQLAQDEELIQRHAADLAALEAAEGALAASVKEAKADMLRAPPPAPALARAHTASMHDMNLPPPLIPFLSQQSSIAGLSTQSTVAGTGTGRQRQGSPGRAGRGRGGAVNVRHSDDSLAKAINTFTSAAQAVSQPPPVIVPSQGDAGAMLGVVQAAAGMPSLKYSSQEPSNRRGSRPAVDLAATSINRSAYLRQAKSHSPPRGLRGRSEHSGLSRRQRLRTDALNQSMESFAVGKRSSSVVLSRKDQINRDTERSYYAHEQQMHDIHAGIPTSGPIPAANAAIAAQAVSGGAALGALNTSMATSISGISDTMITYEGQPAKTRFLTPYFKKDPRAPILEDPQGGRNRGLYGEGLWLPNTTALAPSVPLGVSRAAAVKKVQFGHSNSEPKLTSETLAAAAAATAGSGVGESKSETTQPTQIKAQAQAQTQTQSLGPRPSTKAIITSMVDRISNAAGAEAEVMSTTSVTTSQPSVEVVAARPHRTHIAPRDNLVGSRTQVRRASKKK